LALHWTDIIFLAQKSCPRLLSTDPGPFAWARILLETDQLNSKNPTRTAGPSVRPEPKLSSQNLDPSTVAGFGQEWFQFTQKELTDKARDQIFADYFRIFPWHRLPAGSVGADIGCGSGRWARVVANRVGCLHLVDASSQALEVARENLKTVTNVRFHHASVDILPFEDNSLDFAYSLGVLHHVPDTAEAIREVARKLKTGAPLLLYLYYRFDNCGLFYRSLWKVSDLGRRLISRLPFSLRYAASQFLALLVYLPLARTALVLAFLRILPSGWPLAYYRDKPWYVMRTDALDRFGTKLEQRYSRREIETMMSRAGLENIQFSDSQPYWCGVGFKQG